MKKTYSLWRFYRKSHQNFELWRHLKKIGNLNSAFEKTDSQSSAYDFEKYFRNPLQKCFEFFYHHLWLSQQFTESQAA
jgi:hypothetical protein